MPVKGVVANVEFSVFHPLNFDGAVFDVEVVAEEVVFGGVGLPVELAGDLVPEGVGVLHAQLVHLLVLVLRAAVRLGPEKVRRAVHVRHLRIPVWQNRTSREY